MQNLFFLILFSISNSSSSVDNSDQSLRRNKRGHGGEDVPYDHPIFSVKEEHVPYLSPGDLDNFSQFAEDYPDVELPEALEDAIADYDDGVIEFVPLENWEDVEAALQVYNDNPNLEPQPHIYPYFDSIFYITEEELQEAPQEGLDSIQQYFLDNPHLIVPPHYIPFFSSTTTPTTTTTTTPATTTTTTLPTTTTTTTTTTSTTAFIMKNTPPHLNPDYDPESSDEESSNDEEPFEVWTVPPEDVQFILENTPPRMASTTSTTIPPQTSTTTTRESATNFAMQNTPPHLNPTSTTTTYSTPQFIMENTPPALSNQNQAISSTTQSSTPVASGVNTDPPANVGSQANVGVQANVGAQGVSSTPASVSQVSQCKYTFIIISYDAEFITQRRVTWESREY